MINKVKKPDKKYSLFIGLILITVGFLTFAFMIKDNRKYDSFAEISNGIKFVGTYSFEKMAEISGCDIVKKTKIN